MEAREGGDGGFRPRATVEDIQRRLLRPSPSLHSPAPTPFCRGKNAQGRNSSQFKANYTGLYRNREAKKGETLIKKRKLEDYLDPVLLSAVSSKISRMETIPKMTVKREVRDFEWPVDELRMLMQDTAVGKEKIDAVNLGNDSDNLLENDEDGDVLFSTPFQKFEQTALSYKWPLTLLSGILHPNLETPWPFNSHIFLFKIWKYSSSSGISLKAPNPWLKYDWLRGLWEMARTRLGRHLVVSKSGAAP